MTNEKLKLQQLNRLTIDEFKKTDKNPIILVADNIRSGQNVGSLFRTADSFGLAAVFLAGISPLPPNKEVLKTALGATESVDWQYFTNHAQLLAYLKANGYLIVCVEQTTQSMSLASFVPDSALKYALILGNEVDGVSDEMIKNADLCIEIPQVGTKHSLNVSVCAGIVTWHFYQHII
jgi:23S rRNA (guanosine2251-2'-O)-methyltransferase